MAKLTGEMIKAGLRIFVAAYERKTHNQIPVELVVVSGKVERDSNILHVVFEDKKQENSTFGVSIDPKSDNPRYLVYLGDDGVRPFNYDERCTQVFTTKEEVDEMLKMCGGRYPNFVCEDYSDKPSRESFPMLDDYDYS